MRYEENFINDAAEMLKVMGHPLRIRIAQFLESGERNVGDIAIAIDASQSTTSQHLRAMRVRGLLDARRDATNVYYSIARPEVYKIIQCIREGQLRSAEQASQKKGTA
jgi:DNA-binding transcriptional ArsR family regulator